MKSRVPKTRQSIHPKQTPHIQTEREIFSIVSENRQLSAHSDTINSAVPEKFYFPLVTPKRDNFESIY